MRKTSNLIVASFMALASLASTVQVSSAAIRGGPEATVIKINGEGFRTCKAKKNSGKSFYRAKVRGFLIDGSGGGIRSDGNSRFSVTTCFDKASTCEKWVDRIEHKIPGVYRIHYTNCALRS